MLRMQTKLSNSIPFQNPPTSSTFNRFIQLQLDSLNSPYRDYLTKVKNTPTNHNYIRTTETTHLQCNDFFKGSQNAINEYKQQNRTKIEDIEEWADFPVDCESIKSRVYFQTERLYLEEESFPIAFTRAVYKVGFNELVN